MVKRMLPEERMVKIITEGVSMRLRKPFFSRSTHLGEVVRRKKRDRGRGTKNRR